MDTDQHEYGYTRVTMDDPNNNIRPSSYYVQDASFVRLKNMKIGYSVPQSILSKIKFNSLYIYAQATNLFTITDTTVSIRKWDCKVTPVTTVT